MQTEPTKRTLIILTLQHRTSYKRRRAVSPLKIKIPSKRSRLAA
jgi:hypothetical protein